MLAGAGDTFLAGFARVLPSSAGICVCPSGLVQFAPPPFTATPNGLYPVCLSSSANGAYYILEDLSSWERLLIWAVFPLL